MSEPITLRDAAGRPISPQQTSEYRRGQPPRNKGQRVAACSRKGPRS